VFNNGGEMKFISENFTKKWDVDVPPRMEG
jgi:hypothetical protein